MTEQPSTQAPAPAKQRGGRDLPAAIVVGVALALSVILSLAYFHWGFILLLTVLFSIGAVEVHHAMKRVTMTAAIQPIVVGTALSLVASYAAATRVGGFGLPWHSVLLATLGLTVMAVLIWRMWGGAEGYVRDSAASLFIIGYIPLLGSFIALMLGAENGAARIVSFVLCIVASDTGGYAFGSWLGKHQMAPRISPKKTWEGFAGSLGTAMVVGVLLGIYVLGSPWWVGLILGVTMVVFGTAGDLIESLIKRDVGIKDMSSILPGHGGVMDRLDSMLVAAPAAWLVLYLLVPGG